MNLVYISLIFGFLSCIFVVVAFSYETISMFKKKTSKTLTMGSLALQIISASSGCVAASINIYNSGIENIPFLVTNIGVLINVLLLIIMKLSFRNS